jgi:serine/threonine protein kinase
MQNTNVNKQKIRENKERIRNKVKSLNLSSKLKYEQSEAMRADAESQRRCKSMFYSTRFESLFELGDKLGTPKFNPGEGAHGVVRKCVERSTGNTYCVKITQGDEEYIRISKKTYQLLYLVDSPHVIKPKSLFINESTETIYLVMEYCPYPSLQR